MSAKFRDMITVEVRKEMSHQKCDKLDYMHQNLNHLSNLNLHHMTIYKKGRQCRKGWEQMNDISQVLCTSFVCVFYSFPGM